ncbi:MAG: MBL fold metallo-hydrolase [Enterocloster bolteae]
MNLVVGKEKALVFDTGSGTDDIHGMVRKLTGLPLVVINSHGHFDHIGGNSQFDTVYMHQDDFVILESYTAELLGQWDNMKALDFDTFNLGEMECRDYTAERTFKGVGGGMDTEAPFAAVRGCSYTCYVPYISKPYDG